MALSPPKPAALNESTVEGYKRDLADMVTNPKNWASTHGDVEGIRKYAEAQLKQLERGKHGPEPTQAKR